MRRNLFSFLQIIKAPRSFNKEAETRKVTCPFILFSFFNFFIIRISRNCKHVHVDHDHSNFPPGDLHADSDHGGLLPLLDSDPHLQPPCRLRTSWTGGNWQSDISGLNEYDIFFDKRFHWKVLPYFRIGVWHQSWCQSV